MRAFQLGLEWFPERAGGLPRYYYDLFRFAPSLFGGGGMVLGSDKVAADTGGRVLAFASEADPLPKKIAGARRTFASLARTYGPDVVASHFALFTVPVLDRIDRPLVVHFHGPWAAEGAVEGTSGLRTRMKRLVETTVYRRAQRFVVLSQAFGDVLHRDYGVPGDRIRVVPGGVDTARFNVGETRQEARERLGWAADRPTIVSVRRLARRMGLDVLVDAMRRVVARHPDVLLLIAGRGPLHGELATRIAAHGLEANVRLLGFVADADLPLVYRAADLSVVPTQALEGFGLIALESLAAGTPVLVTPVGGLPEVAGPLSAGLVFPGSDADTMATRLVEVLDAGTLPDAAACRAYAEAFAWPAIAARVDAVYQEALA